MSKDTQSPTYNLFSPDPYPIYRQMQDRDPVYYSESLGYWIVTSYRDVEAALKDKRFSSDRSALFVHQLGDLDINLIQNFMRVIGNMMLEKDPPVHTQMRKVADRGFTARALESWRGIIEQNTDRLLDRVQQQGYMDIVADLAASLPALTIAEIFGVPERDRANLIQWGTDIITLWGTPNDPNIEAVARRADNASIQFTQLIQQLIEDRRHQPGTDMISLLIAAYEAQGLDLAELPSLCVLILNAGHISTCDLIPNGISALLDHPEQLKQLIDRPELIPSAVEEMIRYDTPTPFTFRVTKEAIVLSGKTIPAGSVVALGLGAANHDLAKFTHPDRFEIDRSPNEHLGFAPGIHYCLGVVLARMELAICFTTLLRRMPNLQRDPAKPAIPRKNSLAFKGFESMPVRF
jgi:pimeloyl-[acyl-carrier protein] synthase